MSDFLKEARKRQKEEDRIKNIHKKSREISQKLQDEIEALCVMAALTSDSLQFENTRFQATISEIVPEQKHNVVSRGRQKTFSFHGFLSPYVNPAKKIKIRKIKGNKSIVELDFQPSEEILYQLKKFKSIKTAVEYGFYGYRYIDSVEITISNLDKLIDSKIFTRLLTMLIKEIVPKEEKVV